MGVDGGTGSGGTQTRYVYVDTVVYTTGPSRTVITRKERHGSTVYVYRTIYRHRAPSLSPQAEHASLVTAQGDTGGGGSFGGDSWIEVRQRLLRALGYNVRVDGVWGPQSQSAWNQYLGGGGSSTVTAQQINRVTETQRRLRQVQRTAERAQKLSIERRQTLELNARAARERAKNGASPYLDTEDFKSDLLVRADRRHDRELAESQAIYAASQAANDRARTAARQRVIFRRDPSEARKLTISQLAEYIGNPASEFNPLDATDVRIVQTYLKANGHPDLRVDGNWGTATNSALIADLRRARARERKEQNEALVEAFYESGVLQAGGDAPWWWPLTDQETPRPGELLRLLNQGGFTASIILRELVSRWQSPGAQYAYWRSEQIRRLHRSLVTGTLPDPYRLLGRGSVPEWLRVMRLTSASQFLAPADGVRLNAQLSALLNSRTMDEFQRNIYRYQREEETALVNRLREEAEANQSFWGKAWEQIVRPGEWLRTTIIAIDTAMDDPANQSGWFDVNLGILHVTEEEMEAARQRIEEMDTFERIVFELVVDPINFVPFGRIASLTGKGIGGLGRATTSLGLTLQRSNSIARDFGLVVAAVGKGLEATPHGRMYLRDYSHRLVQTLSHVHPNSSVGREMVAGIINGARLATRLKQEALIDAQNAVRWSARHAFRPVKALGIAGLRDYKISAETRKLVTFTRQEVKDRLVVVLPDLSKELRALGGSLYVDQARSLLSSVGASVQARAFEEIRLHSIKRLARRYAGDVEDAALRDGIVPAQARAMAEAEYKRVRGAFATHRVGAGDPELLRELDALDAALADQWDDVILPALQDLLEEWAELSGLKLWDEAGVWSAELREAEGILKLRELARESFEGAVRVANPQYGKYVSFDQYLDLTGSEIRRRQSAVQQWAARERAVGGTVDEEWLAGRLAEEKEAVLDSWKNTEKGWTDIRETIEVSPLYARNFVDVTEEAMERELADLARVGGEWIGSGLEGEISRLSAWLGGGPVAPFGSAGMEIPQQLAQRMGGFTQAVKHHQLALARAMGEATPYALARRLAMMQALATAQSRPLRYLYNGVQGSLSAWIFLTLPFRPGWVVRNVVDNLTKLMIRGAHDPRAYFPNVSAKLGEGIVTVFDLNLRAIRHVAYFLDDVMGTQVGRWLDGVYETFWQHGVPTLKKIFESHMIPVPDGVLEASKWRPYQAARPRSAQQALARRALLSGDDDLVRAMDEQPLLRALDTDSGFRARVESFKDGVWELMASKPEGFFKKALYRDEYYKLVKEGKTEIEAFKGAWAKVEDTLFDYNKLTVTEENFRVFFPFIQFWRKNTTFWAKQAVTKPQLPYTLARFEQLRDELHEDLPEWMRRYFKVELPFADVISKVPGMDWLADFVGNHEVYLDPLNYFSFAPMYRAFKDSNPLLPADKRGWAFIAPFADAVEQWGLGFNPFFRRPMADLGVFDYRAWQQVFPQTSPIAAFTRAFLSDRWADRIIDLDAWLGDPLFQSLGIGPDASRKLAEQRNQYVQMEMANQAARGEPVSRERAEEKIEDWFLVQTLLGYFTGFYVRRITPEDLFLYQMSEDLWKQKVDFDSFTDEEKRAYSLWKKRGWSPLEFDRYLEIEPLVQAYYRQDSFEAGERFKRENPEIIPFVDPAFRGRAFPSEGIRDAQLVMDTQSAIDLFRLVDTLELSVETTKLATGMLVTPELKEFWARNDTPAEIRERMLRGEYFRYVNGLSRSYFAIPEDDFEAREGFLAEHPVLQMFWSANDSRSDSYKAIINGVNADLRDVYFELVEDVGFDGAQDFLHRFPFIFEFTRAAGKVDAEGNWVGAEGKGMSQHAQDYLAAKQYLDFYFSLPESERSAWLNSGNPGAQIVLDYFKKYSSFHAQARGFNDFLDTAISATRNAELRLRLQFWKRYFALSPDKRPGFVDREAADHGVFIFGIFGERQREQARAEWLRRAIAFGASPRAAAYLWVKPLLDFFFTLGHKQRQLFVRANPELEWYFDNFARNSLTDDPKLDRLLDRYFNLPPGSQERALMLRQHPEIQDFFDERSTPAERALHRLLEVYFDIPSGPQRKEFLLKHPEIQEYFDRRARQRDRTEEQLLAFELADPRLEPYREGAQNVLSAAERERARLAAGRHSVGGLSVRTEREPA